MVSNAIVVCAAATLWGWSCASADVFPAVGPVVSTSTADGPSLAEISRVIEARGLGEPFDLLAAWMTGDDGGGPAEGKKRSADRRPTRVMEPDQN